MRRIGGMQVRWDELAWGTHDEKTVALFLPVPQAGAREKAEFPYTGVTFFRVHAAKRIYTGFRISGARKIRPRSPAVAVKCLILRPVSLCLHKRLKTSAPFPNTRLCASVRLRRCGDNELMKGGAYSLDAGDKDASVDAGTTFRTRTGMGSNADPLRRKG